MDSFETRANRLLGMAYRGVYHMGGKITKFHEDNEFEHWEWNEYQDLSTYDFDLLTRLVIGAHEECIRLSVMNSGPRLVKLRIWPRDRDEKGNICRYHNTIEEAIEDVRKWNALAKS